ncbi:hypothetical protein GA0070216_101323 [Micromonospora matsumotoense]|uniref:Clumping factor A n=1 Tax=Micromonospora matsumotoense TaxID=121616 RepID=A0A1C4U8B5_9ACTN|nr:hypothetical protein [Micromonospora matsumotoense]SCE67940.1 hypothetical protein GA0070216_101323 [Micromonospora matsumotoense]
MLVASLLLILVAVVLLVLGLVDGSSTLLTSSLAASLLAAVALVTGARQAAATRARAAERTQAAGPSAAAARPPASPAVTVPSETPTTYAPTTIDAGGAGWRQPPGPPVAGEPVGGSTRPDAGAWEPDAEAPWDPVVVPSPPDPGRADPPTDHTPGRVTDPVRIDADDYPDDPRGDPVDDPAWAAGDDLGPPWEPSDDAASPWDPPAQRVPPGDAARVAQLDAEVLVVDGHPRYHLLSCAHLIEREHEPLPVHEAISLGFTPCGLCKPDTALLADTYPR